MDGGLTSLQAQRDQAGGHCYRGSPPGFREELPCALESRVRPCSLVGTRSSEGQAQPLCREPGRKLLKFFMTCPSQPEALAPNSRLGRGLSGEGTRNQGNLEELGHGVRASYSVPKHGDS